MKSQIAIILGILMIIPTVSALESNYVYEYHVEDEFCTAIDQFVYKEGDKVLLTTVLQCTQGNISLLLFIDELGEYEFVNGIEPAHIYHARDMMRRGEFSEQMYLLEESFNLCNFFDAKVLREQSVSLGVEGAQIGSEIFIPKHAGDVKDTSKILKSLGAVKKLNIYDLGASVACTSALNNMQEVVQKDAECYTMAVHLRHGQAHAGTVNELEKCNGELSTMITSLEQSLGQVVLDAANAVGSIFKGFWDASTGKTEELEFKDTQLQQLRKLRNRLNKDFSLKHPHAKQVGSASVERITERRTMAELEYFKAKDAYEDVQETDWWELKYEWRNLLREPDLNYTDHKEELTVSKNHINNAADLYHQQKYNSVIDFSSRAYDLIQAANNSIVTQHSIEQEIPKEVKWTFRGIGIGILVFLILIFYLLRRGEWNN